MNNQAKKNCVGPDSEKAGFDKGCEGCPMKDACLSRKKSGTVDPSILQIQNNLKKVNHKILILSGKGGVGKSTFASQLSFILSDDNAMSDTSPNQVGILDIDLCGPSIPTIFQVSNHNIRQTTLGFTPVYPKDNLGIISIDFLLKSRDNAVIWRGPKKNGLIVQFLRDVYWGEDGLDYLIIDTPPGTSDEHITVCKYLKECDLDGAVIITTPQNISSVDVRKEVSFCRKMGIRVLGVVENMSGFCCPKCGVVTEIFLPTSGGGRKIAEDFGLVFLGKVPLDPVVMRATEFGKSVVESFPKSAAAKALFDIANSKFLGYLF